MSMSSFSILAQFSGRALMAPLLGLMATLGLSFPAIADSSGVQLASYYDRHMAISGGIAYGWTGKERPTAMVADVVQVGVGKDSYYALRKDGTLLTWSGSPANAAVLMRDVEGFAAGSSGWLAINRTWTLWHGTGAAREPPRKIAERVLAAAVGDGADYYVTLAGELFVRGLAHRGQYGDGRLAASSDFVKTAEKVVAVKAQTGHALYLDKSGEVFGTGGNVKGPLSTHGLGDKAASWGRIFTGAKGIATGASHSVAIREDGSLWAWGSGFAVEPSRIAERIVTVAAGSGTTLALAEDGKLWAWEEGGQGPRLISLGR
jgi:alpha-tubulin suppressor-like RCC1 family protein